jgi:acyl-homoserine-lactone acylase
LDLPQVIGAHGIVRRAPTRNTKHGTAPAAIVLCCCGDFGKKVRAQAITAGGESGDPKSSYFNNQALRYANGNLRECIFYPTQLQGHTERNISW